MTLAEWLSEKKMTDEAFADRIGISRTMVTKLRNRTTTPSAHTAMMILEATAGRVPLPDLMPSVPKTEACPS